MTSTRSRPHYSLTDHWNAKAVVFLLLAVAGLIGTLVFNVRAVADGRDYLGDWVGSGPAVSSMLVDLLVVAIAASVLMVLEARRLGMRRVWLYIVLSGLTAIAFTFPLFLSMRERRIIALAADRG